MSNICEGEGPLYPYQPLSTKFPEIRILELKPATHPDKTLKCHLRHTDLRTAEYAALSYSWGAGRKQKSRLKIKDKRTLAEDIKVKNSRHKDPKTVSVVIDSNLSRALRCLRRKDRSVFLWTDKLCINQDLRVEKDNQIELMSQIYARATNVHAWIGPSCDEDGRDEDERTQANVHIAFELAARMWTLAQGVKSTRRPSEEGEWLEACFAVASDEAIHQRKLQQKQTSSSVLTQQLDKQDVSSLWTGYALALRTAVRSDTGFMNGLHVFKDLSKLKWFSRIWILQEYGRARSLSFHYSKIYPNSSGSLRTMSSRSTGESRLCPDSLQSSHLPIFLALSLADSFSRCGTMLAAQPVLQDLDRRYLTCILARTACRENISVGKVLQTAFHSPQPIHEATDPKDLVNARLGLAMDGEEYRDIVTRYFLAPGTVLNAARVFASASRYLLSTGFVDTLIDFKPYEFMRGPPKHLLAEGAEKWIKELALDWHLPSWAYEWSKDGLHTATSYNACNDISPRLSFTKHPRAVFGEVMVISGVHVGIVQDHSYNFSEYVLEAGLGKGAIVYADLHTDIPPLSSSQRATIRVKISTLHEHLNLPVSHTDIERLFDVQEFPAAQFWCWWTAWVKELQRLSGVRVSQQMGIPASSPNIAELLFREASSKLQDDISVVESIFGTTSDLSLFVDLQRWTRILFSDDPRLKAVGIELAESLFRSAWGMCIAVLNTGHLCYVPEDTVWKDTVVVLYGVKAPLVLHTRESGSAYSIVGPAHIIGAMQGDLMKRVSLTEEYTIL